MTEHSPGDAVAMQHADGRARADKSIFRVIIRAANHKVRAELTRTDAVLPFFFNAVCETTTLGVKAPVRMRPLG